MADIGVVATSGTFKRLVEKVTGNPPNLVMQFGVLDQGVEVAKELVKNHSVKVIITTGLTGEMIKQVVNVPVINLEVSNFQLLIALHQARAISDKLCFLDIASQNRNYDLHLISQLLGFEVPTVRLFNLASAQQAVQQAKQRGVEVLVVTGNCIRGLGKSLGLSSILVTIGEEEMDTALRYAYSILDAKKKEQERLHWYEVMQDNSYDASMLVDKHGLIYLCNKTFEEYFACPPGSLQNRHIADLFCHYPILAKIYNNGEPVVDEVIEFRGQQFTLNRSIIMIGDQNKGCVINLQQAAKIQELERKVRKDLHRQRMITKYQFDDIIGDSPSMRSVKQTARRYADSRFPILITGESGTGKEVFSQSIHNVSPYKNGPFLGINCAALQESLLESELFGYDEGAFTGAKKGGKIGLFELVHGGTIFLDEISEMSLTLQSRLLRVLQEKEVIRVGGNTIIPVDTRVICATNKDLKQQIAKGLFRQDLYYRINTLTLELPPLRQRKEDIPSLVQRVFNEVCQELGKNLSLAHYYLQRLQEYNWPGNIRELRGFIEKLILLAEPDKEQISADIFNEVFEPLIHNELIDQKDRSVILENSVNNQYVRIKLGTMEYMESEIIDKLYEYYNNDKERLSKELGISKTTLWRRFKNKEYLN